MNRSRALLVLAAFVIFGALTIAGGRESRVRAQDGCLHGPDETAAEKQRRVQAVMLSRQINSQQQRSRSSKGSFVSQSDLSGLPAAPGFEVGLVTNGKIYAFSVKDTLDPCGLAFFSDHNGLIYEGKALR
jgi:hypothetical protein